MHISPTVDYVDMSRLVGVLKSASTRMTVRVGDDTAAQSGSEIQTIPHKALGKDDNRGPF